MDELNSKMARGIAWMALFKVAVRFTSLVSTVILARLLIPADFGLVAMATSLIALLELATAFKFDIPLIQNQNAGRSHFDTAWTLNIMFHGALSILLLGLAEPAAAFFREDRLPPVIYMLAVGFFAAGFSNIGVVYFRKELNFRKDFWVMLSKKLIGFVITIPLAFWLRSYWALVFGMVAGNVLSVVATYVLHPYRPRFSLSNAREMLGFSKWLVLNNLVEFLRMRSPDFIIGRVSGAAALGLFSVAYQISVMPVTEIVAPINRVTYPAFAKLASNVESLRKSYCDTFAIIALCALPAGFGVSVVADPLVDLFLGPKWVEAAPLISLLAVFGAVHSLHTNTGSLYNAIGKPWLITFTGACNVGVLLVAAIILHLKFGVMGIAAAFLGTSILLTPFNFYILCRQINLTARGLLALLWRPFFSSLAMVLVVTYVDWMVLSEDTGPGATLSILVLCGAISYCVALAGFWLASGASKSTVEFRLASLFWRKAHSVYAGSG